MSEHKGFFKSLFYNLFEKRRYKETRLNRVSKDRAWYEKRMSPDNIQKYYEGSFADRNNALFDLMKNFLPNNMVVADIAAGSCHMATNFFELETREHEGRRHKDRDIKKYHWNDFNRNVIKEVEARIDSNYLKINRLKQNFFIHDFDAEDISAAKMVLSEANVMICVSMEHIQHDIGLIRSLKKGAVIGLCSPNCGGSSHVRMFNNIDEFKERYSGLIDIKAESMVRKNKKVEKYLLCGIKK